MPFDFDIDSVFVFDFAGDLIYVHIDAFRFGLRYANAPGGVHTAAPGLYSSAFVAVAVASKNTIRRLCF